VIDKALKVGGLPARLLELAANPQPQGDAVPVELPEAGGDRSIGEEQDEQLQHERLLLLCVLCSEKPTLADLFNSEKFAGILNIFFNRYEKIMNM
jgi:hypothetical protein